MRWKITDKPVPKEGDVRIKHSFFLLIPKLIDKEWRWLESAWWEEERKTAMCLGPDGVMSSYPCIKWVATRWVSV